MTKILFVLTLAIVAVQWARPRGDPHVAVLLEGRLVFQRPPGVAAVGYTVRVRGGQPVYLRGSPETPPVVLERLLDGQWVTHHHQYHGCAELPLGRWHDAIHPGETCSARIVARAPGRYRVRIAYSTRRTGRLVTAFSRAVTVAPPPETGRIAADTAS